MNKTPIIILTKDNPEYLYVMLKSFTATNIENNPVVIVDDCSTYEKTKKLLYTNDAIDVKFDDWTITDEKNTQELADKEAAQNYIDIPKMNRIIGIGKKFITVSTPRYLGQMNRTLFGIKLAFDMYPTAQNCVILDDDILFNRDWLKMLLKINSYESFKNEIAMISVYSEKLRDKDAPEYYQDDMIAGKCILFTHKFYNQMCSIGLLKNMTLSGEGTMYNKLQRLAKNLGFISIVSRDSYIQNLEKRNLVNKDKVLKFEKNFVMPIAWNEEF